MKKVITYGTYDLLHQGHIRLLERAKALGDYLIVGVTSEDFDKKRGKINVQQTLMERVQAVKATGLADEIIIEEYEGQKIEDICKYGIDIFTVGSDWEGKFDYLKEYCEVIYLPRTTGISSTDLRSKSRQIRLGLVGEHTLLEKVAKESKLVNGLEMSALFSSDNTVEILKDVPYKANTYEDLLKNVDAVYIVSHPKNHFEQVKMALENHKHVLCEVPIALSKKECKYLHELAQKNNCILMSSLKTAYATAYSRLLLLIKGGVIGDVVSVDSTCTSLRNIDYDNIENTWNSICSWGPTAMLPIFQILGTQYLKKNIVSICSDKIKDFDLFTKVDFTYKDAVASLKVGKGVKSEGELVVTGTKGYAYVPAPWWKTDYFEIRYEDQTENRRYFYQLEGEGIRNKLLSFVRSIKENIDSNKISESVTTEISNVIESFYNEIDITKSFR